MAPTTSKGSLKNLGYLKELGNEEDFDIPIPSDYIIPQNISKMDSKRYKSRNTSFVELRD